MHNLILELQQDYKKKTVVDVRSGDTVKVTQRIVEGNRQRLQVFEGLVLRVRRRKSLTYSILVRKIASGVAVEKSFLMHAPNVVSVEIVKRAKVRRNYLSYMRGRAGRAARLKSIDFDKKAVNAANLVSDEDKLPQVKDQVVVQDGVAADGSESQAVREEEVVEQEGQESELSTTETSVSDSSPAKNQVIEDAPDKEELTESKEKDSDPS